MASTADLASQKAELIQMMQDREKMLTGVWESEIAKMRVSNTELTNKVEDIAQKLEIQGATTVLQQMQKIEDNIKELNDNTQLLRKEMDIKNDDKDKVWAKLQDMREDIKNLHVQEERGGTKAKDDPKKHCMTTRRNFNSLPKYGGKHEEFEDLKFKVKTFLSEEVEYKELLLVLDTVTAIPDKDVMEKIMTKVEEELKRKHQKDGMIDRQWINHQLYQVLCLNLEGKALSMIKNLHDSADNGILGWCKLQQDCTSLTAQRLQGLANRVYQPKRCKQYGEVSAAIEEWEMSAAALARAEEMPEGTLKEITKMYSLKQLVPEELERDIAKASITLNSYEKVKGYIMEQVAVRRDVKNQSKGPVSLDMNLMKMLASMSGYTGGEAEEWPEEKGERRGRGRTLRQRRIWPTLLVLQSAKRRQRRRQGKRRKRRVRKRRQTKVRRNLPLLRQAWTQNIRMLSQG